MLPCWSVPSCVLKLLEKKKRPWRKWIHRWPGKCGQYGVSVLRREFEEGLRHFNCLYFLSTWCIVTMAISGVLFVTSCWCREIKRTDREESTCGSASTMQEPDNNWTKFLTCQKWRPREQSYCTVYAQLNPMLERFRGFLTSSSARAYYPLYCNQKVKVGACIYSHTHAFGDWW